MNKSNNLSIIILAAGKGTRMKSSLPKVMHQVAGVEMIHLVIKAALALKPQNITIVISKELSQFQSDIQKRHHPAKINFALQDKRAGTAHAVGVGLKSIDKIADNTLILYGDVALITDSTLKKMQDQLLSNNLAILAFDCKEENNYGRLIIDQNNQLKSIVEYKDADPKQRKITLCNSGIMIINSKHLKKLLPKIGNNNAALEYYLTDIIALAQKDHLKCGFIKVEEEEVLGVNSMHELAKVEEIKQNQLRRKFMDLGVKLIDPKTVYFSDDIEIASEVVIHPHVIFGRGVKIAAWVEIKSFCHIEGVIIGEKAIIGPFARIRPDSKIGKQARIGNFVEIKKSVIGDFSKANHLSYIGDTKIGKNSNIGASTITCNYDGYNKFLTEIGDNVFIGSHATLIAPIKIADSTVVGAGSVISKDVEEGDLTVARAKQTNIKNGGKNYHLRKSKTKK